MQFHRNGPRPLKEQNVVVAGGRVVTVQAPRHWRISQPTDNLDIHFLPAHRRPKPVFRANPTPRFPDLGPLPEDLEPIGSLDGADVEASERLRELQDLGAPMLAQADLSFERPAAEGFALLGWSLRLRNAPEEPEDES